MKISRIIALLLALVISVSLVSCNSGHSHSANNSGNSNSGNSNGGSSNSGNDEAEVYYIYSVTAKVLHLSTCYHVERINVEYRTEYRGDISQLMDKGFTLCKTCLAPEDKDPVEEEPEEQPIEDENKISPEDATFVINVNSEKVHELDCRYAVDMKESNKEYTDLSLDELLAIEDKNYTPCATCMPAEAEKHKEEHPEKYEK